MASLAITFPEMDKQHWDVACVWPTALSLIPFWVTLGEPQSTFMKTGIHYFYSSSSLIVLSACLVCPAGGVVCVCFILGVWLSHSEPYHSVETHCHLTPLFPACSSGERTQASTMINKYSTTEPGQPAFLCTTFPSWWVCSFWDAFLLADDVGGQNPFTF